MPIFGRPPPPKPEPTATDEPDPELDQALSEMEKVVAWRAIGLLDRQFPLDAVVMLAHQQDVLHTVDALLERGCSIEFIVDQLT